MRPILLGEARHQVLFHAERSICLRQSEAVTESEDVGVHRDGISAECDGIDDIRRLAPDAGESLERVPITRDFAAVQLYYDIRRGKDVFRLIMIKPTDLDLLLEILLRKGQDRLRRGIIAKEIFRHDIHPFIGALRRQDDCHQELIWGGKTQLAFCLGMHLFE